MQESLGRVRLLCWTLLKSARTGPRCSFGGSASAAGCICSGCWRQFEVLGGRDSLACWVVETDWRTLLLRDQHKVCFGALSIVRRAGSSHQELTGGVNCRVAFEVVILLQTVELAHIHHDVGNITDTDCRQLEFVCDSNTYGAFKCGVLLMDSRRVVVC